MSSVKSISRNGKDQSDKKDLNYPVISLVPDKLYSDYYESGFNAQSGAFHEPVEIIKLKLNDAVRSSFSARRQAKAFLAVHKSMNQLKYLCHLVAEAGELNNDHLAQLEVQAEGIVKELSLLSEDLEEETRQYRSVA